VLRSLPARRRIPYDRPPDPIIVSTGSNPVQALADRLAQQERAPWPGQPVPMALVITELDVGGAERALVALATGLDRRRWQPSVIALGPEGPLAEPLRAAGIDTRCLDVNRRRPVQAVLRLASALRARSPRLVQSFLFHANLAARLAAPLAGRPWILGGLRVAERRRNAHVRLDRLTISLCCGEVCVSDAVRRFSQDVGGLPADRLAVIPNGVDVERFDQAEPLDRATLSVPADAHLALFIGRIDPQKGVSVLLDAAGKLIASRPAWHLAIAGDGPERSRLQSATATVPNVHWLGRRDDVPPLLKTADLLVLPSLWEGMPNVVLEAMAAGRAVVATAVEGTSELVIAGQTGWLVPAGDPEPLSDALLDAATDRERLRRFGEAGRARVAERFTLGQMVERYEQVWAGVLGLELPESRG
jgi:glycosyltransferase involved in cell wall biosynthesis